MSHLDTTAAMKLVVAEPESAALVEGLSADWRLVASGLLRAEMHCAAGRHPDEVDTPMRSPSAISRTCSTQ